MGTYDSLRATVKCPNCEELIFDADVQTKSLGCNMKTIQQGEDIREVIAPEFVIQNSMIECMSACGRCNAYFHAFAKIRGYVFEEVIVDKNIKPTIIPNFFRSLAE